MAGGGGQLPVGFWSEWVEGTSGLVNGMAFLDLSQILE